MSQESAPIVVGTVGDDASLAALRWAADEAAAHGAPLIAVHVFDPRDQCFAPYARPEAWDARDLEACAMVERQLADSGLREVKRVFEVGVPSQVLVRFAIGARMLVLGHADHHCRHDGEGAHHAPALGSVARSCAAGATCPVVVVPVPAQRPAPAKADPEPQRVPVARESAVTGGRALYPTHQRVPIGHG